MKRASLLLIISVLWVLGSAGSAAAAGSKVAKYMGDLRWGMTESEVIRYLETRLDGKYKPLIRKAVGRRETALREEVRRLKREIRSSYVEFEGQRTRWDRSVVAGEYNNDNEESMLVFEGDGYESHYLFHEGRLWKWVKAVNTQKFGGRSLKILSKKLKRRFGKGRKKSGERNSVAGRQSWLEYRDRTSRLRAVDVARSHGQFALVFVELSTARQLAAVSKRKSRRSGGSRLASAPERSRAPASASRSGKRRRSIFGGGGGQQESEREYRTRAKREKRAALSKQRRMHARSSDNKKGRVLDSLQGMDEDDPMSGL